MQSAKQKAMKHYRPCDYGCGIVEEDVFMHETGCPVHDPKMLAQLETSGNLEPMKKLI